MKFAIQDRQKMEEKHKEKFENFVGSRTGETSHLKEEAVQNKPVEHTKKTFLKKRIDSLREYCCLMIAHGSVADCLEAIKRLEECKNSKYAVSAFKAIIKVTAERMSWLNTLKERQESEKEELEKMSKIMMIWTDEFYVGKLKLKTQ